jgi:hypothetical protein
MAVQELGVFGWNMEDCLMSHNATTLNGLDDVDTTGAIDGQVLTFGTDGISRYEYVTGLPVSTKGTLPSLSQPIGTEFSNPITMDGLKFSVKIAGDAVGNWYNLYMTNQKGSTIGVWATGHTWGSEHEVFTTHNAALANNATVMADGAYSYGNATYSSANTLLVAVLAGGVWNQYIAEAHSFDVGTVQHCFLSVTKRY